MIFVLILTSDRCFATGGVEPTHHRAEDATSLTCQAPLHRRGFADGLGSHCQPHILARALHTPTQE